ncbi:MAG: hypothetical protein QME64_09070 [bacterium]|nr:hypothetical protein [bacterium]
MHGYGRNRRGSGLGNRPVTVPQGYTYIGPCRCGCGPDAYYQDANGRILHAAQVFATNPDMPISKSAISPAVEQMKQEKAVLEKRIQELESQLHAKQ